MTIGHYDNIIMILTIIVVIKTGMILEKSVARTNHQSAMTNSLLVTGANSLTQTATVAACSACHITELRYKLLIGCYGARHSRKT